MNGVCSQSLTRAWYMTSISDKSLLPLFARESSSAFSPPPGKKASIFVQTCTRRNSTSPSYRSLYIHIILNPSPPITSCCILNCYGRRAAVHHQWPSLIDISHLNIWDFINLKTFASINAHTSGVA